MAYANGFRKIIRVEIIGFHSGVKNVHSQIYAVGSVFNGLQHTVKIACRRKNLHTNI